MTMEDGSSDGIPKQDSSKGVTLTPVQLVQRRKHCMLSHSSSYLDQLPFSTMSSTMEESMKQETIFGPFFAMHLLTIIVWIYMYMKRIPFIVSYIEKHKCANEELGNPSSKHYLNNISPPSVRNPSDNLKNLFELPILFYAMILYLYATHNVDLTYVKAAWIFVIFRYIHSAIHCTFNATMPRFHCYCISSIALFFIIIRAFCAHEVEIAAS